MEKKYNDFKTHIVKKEDKTQTICSQYGITEDDLVKANPQVPLVPYGGGFFSTPTYRLDIKEGDTLKIPFYNEDKAKSGIKAIKGKSLVKVGEWETYEIEEWYEGTAEEERNPANVKWDLYYLKNGTSPEKILEKEKGHFRFQEKAVGNKYKIVAYLNEPELTGPSALVVNVEASEKAEILNVKISDINNKPISEPLSYGQTINAHVETSGMKGQYVYISLWEDDAEGSGHSEGNKHNLIAENKALVGDKGVAHLQFVLKADFKKVANAHLAKGDSSEGSKHEYYVTAFASGQTKASDNINVRNPDFQKERKKETGNHLEGKKQPPKPAVPPFSQKVPVQQPKTPAAPASQKSGISSVTFSDANGRPLSGTIKQSALRVNIKSNGLKGKEIRFKVYEEDLIDDQLLLVKNFTITGDDFAINLALDKIPKSSGDDILEGSSQELFVDVEILESKKHIKSAVIEIDVKAFKTEVAKNTTVSKVADSKLPKAEDKKTECICKEQYADLIWGAKVSCEFRKKVVKIAKGLGKEPNLLMAAMALETGKTFSPTAGKGTSYVGLIQFGDDAASSVGTTTDALLKMTALEQLDYVEKYLTKKKDKLTTLTDFYMSILMPVDVGKGSQANHVVFDNTYPLAYKKDGKTLTDLSKSRHYGYRQNPAFFFEEGEKEKVKKGGGKKYDGEGKTYIWEIEKFLSNVYNEGKNHKVKTFACNKAEEAKPVTTESGTWNVIITEKYTGKKCEHEKVRANCRRGKIDVYDHNKKIVFTISDCLLEGVAGEDRMKTNSDAPFGTYAISSAPFIMGSKSGQKRISYGPQPRLSFEPINGSGDEADKSNRSLIRIHGGRQEDKTTYKPLSNPVLKRTQGCIRVYDTDAKGFYDWWVKFHKANPNVKPGKLKIVK